MYGGGGLQVKGDLVAIVAVVVVVVVGVMVGGGYRKYTRKCGVVNLINVREILI